jgi:hypothetical protein
MHFEMPFACNLWLCRYLLSALSSIGWQDFSVRTATSCPPIGGLTGGEFESDKIVWSHNAWTSRRLQENSRLEGFLQPNAHDTKPVSPLSPFQSESYKDPNGMIFYLHL